MKRTLALAVVACTAHEVPAPIAPAPRAPPPDDAALVSEMEPDVDEADVAPAPAPEPEPLPPQDGWLRGSTHVHAKPSGDSSEPIDNVIAWYEQHGYDFIVLTDHNRVTDTAPRGPNGLVVIAGAELTHNPVGCLPPGDKSRKCRIHVNAIGATARPAGKIEWAERKSHLRVDMYQAAFARAKLLGARLAQINHPQWFWGMSSELLAELAKRGAQLVEIDNVQFEKWNKGDAVHPSMEQVWDGALVLGAQVWGVASDDAHHYRGRGKYPAGGGWIAVRAKKEPDAILDAIAAGRFYASNGVVLARADREGDDVVVEVASGESGEYTIEWIENGAVVETVKAKSSRRKVPPTGYVRAVVVRDDGKRAWTQPARR